MRWLSVLMGLLFVAAAAVQYNDPDPLRWMAAYLLAAAVSLSAAFDRCPTWLAVLGFVAFALPALYNLPDIRHARAESFTQMGMSTVADEEVREALGLLLGALWLGAVLMWRRRSSSP